MKKYSGCTPKASTFSRLESDAHATTCAAVTAASAFPPLMRSQSHCRIVRALSIVSAVVKVLDTTTTSVSSASRPSTHRSTSTESTFDKKRRVKPCDA